MAQQWVDVLTATGGVGFYDNQTGSPVTLPYTRSVPFGENYHGIGILMTTVAAALPANSTILAIRAQGTVVADGAVSGTALMANGMLPGGSDATAALQGTTPVTVVMPETNVAAGATPDSGAHILVVTDASTTLNFTFNLTQFDVLVEVPDPEPEPVRIRVEAFVDIRYSKDGGNNWSHWKRRSLGDVGDFMKRVRVHRLGRGRQWVFDIRVTDNCRAALLAASLQVEGE